MVCLYDEDEEKELQENVEYLKFCINRLNYIMEYECLGDLEKLPYKREKEKLEKKLLTLTE